MMHVDMLDPLRLQSNRIASSEQGMQQGFHPSYQAFLTAKKNSSDQVCNPVPVPEA